MDRTGWRGEERTANAPEPRRTVVGRLKHHVAEWPRQYIEMQVEVFGGGR